MCKESNLAHQEIKGSDPIDSELKDQQVPVQSETKEQVPAESDKVEQTPSD
jgi:hypothetical protein